MLKQKGDAYSALMYSGNMPGDKSNSSGIFKQQTGGLDLQGAFAINKKWAVQSSFFFRKETNHGNTTFNTRDSTLVRYKRSMLEAGVGYYKSIGGNPNYFFQVFGGGGLGVFCFTDMGRMSSDPNYSRFHNANVFKLYLQPALYISSSKHILSTSLSSRFTFLKLYNVKTNYTDAEKSTFLLEYVDKQPYMFWEPTLTVTTGVKAYPKIRLHGQMGYSFLISKRFIDYRSINLSIGAVAVLPKLFKKKT